MWEISNKQLIWSNVWAELYSSALHSTRTTKVWSTLNALTFFRRLLCFLEDRMGALVLAVALLIFAAAPQCSSIATTLDELLSSNACQRQGADAVVCTFSGTLILSSNAWPPGANDLTLLGSTSASRLQLQPSAPYVLLGPRSLSLSSLIIDAGSGTTPPAKGGPLGGVINNNSTAVSMLLSGLQVDPSANLNLMVS